ncbi:MAG: ATP-binding cassette domain-containing protein [Spirochaetota bacterium]
MKFEQTADRARSGGDMDTFQGRGLVKHFPGRRVIRACDGISLTIRQGSILGLVGESGCGKTTVGRLLLALMKPDRGEVLFRGMPLTRMHEKEIRPLRSHFQMIFQDSASAFNPRIRVADALKEAIRLHRAMDARDMWMLIEEILARVNLSRGILYNFVGNLSGGETKRLDIARALCINPDYLVADEPLALLDMSIQSQIANLLMDVREKQNTGILFISHDLRMVEMLSATVAVMYRGRIMEQAAKKEIISEPLHPYTRHLWDPASSVFFMGLKPGGCIYRNSCFLYQKKGFPLICAEQQPPLSEHRPGHLAACHFAGE